MNSNTVIVSMTSYPARIKGVASVWKSILAQSVSKDDYHCVLVLAEPEFPNRVLPADLQALVDNGDVEIIWYPVNIKSHKKLMPTLAKYPDNPILVIDDDIKRSEGWLKTFIDDHRKYPEDIITGTFQFYLNDKLTFERLSGYKQRAAGGKNHIPSLIMNFARPANGCAGTLYPPHTFTDKRFFDEKKMMEMSPTSDESWQYAFNVMADKTMRQTSVIFDESVGFVPGTQQMSTALYRVNKTKYQSIFNNFLAEFPEFKEKMIERQNRCIISLTSYTNRFARLPEVLESLINQTVKASKIVLTLTADDIENITPEIKNFIDSGQVEILEAEENLKPHNKYYYVMKKYPQYAIITVDDDVVYPETMVKTLLAGYQKHPNCVIARRVHKILKDKFGQLLPYSKWVYECKTETQPSLDLLATGVGGVLYPPNILDIEQVDVEDIKKVIRADDIFLKDLENKRYIQVFYVKDQPDTPLNDEATQRFALYKTNCHGGNDESMDRLGWRGSLKSKESVEETLTTSQRKWPKFNPKVVHEKRVIRPGKPGSKYWEKFFNN